MKKSIIILTFIAIGVSANAQYNTPFYQGVSNGDQIGFIGIGISPTVSPIAPLPNFNLHVHGVSDYISPPSTPGGPGGPDPEFLIGTGYTFQGTNNPSSRSTGHGPTSRIGLTNTFTGNDVMDGAVIQMSK